MILSYLKFTRTLVFTICPTVMLNIGDSSTKVFREEYWSAPTNPNFNSENISSGLETGQQKIIAIANDELHNLIYRTDNTSLKVISVLSSELWCHFLTKSRNFNTGHGGGTIFNTDICSRGENWTKQKTNVRKNNLFLGCCLQQMNAKGEWLTFTR